MGLVSEDESPNRMPATVPYNAAFLDRPPPLPSASIAAHSTTSRQIVIAHWVFEAFVLPPAGSP